MFLTVSSPSFYYLHFPTLLFWVLTFSLKNLSKDCSKLFPAAKTLSLTTSKIDQALLTKVFNLENFPNYKSQTPPCPTQVSSFCPQQKTCFFMLCFKLQGWRIFCFILILGRNSVPHHNFSFHKKAELVATSVCSQLVATFQLTLKYLT